MSSYDTGTDESSRLHAPRAAISQSSIALVVGAMGAAATIGAVFLAHTFQMQDGACLDFGTRYGKIDEINDSAVRLRRLKALTSNQSFFDCASYQLARQERDDLTSKLAAARSQKDGSGEILEGHSVSQGVTDPAVIFPKNDLSTPAPRPAIQANGSSPVITALASPLPPAPAETRMSEAMPAPAPSQSLTVASLAETNTATPPVLTVTPQSLVFSGQVGDRLTLSRGINYSLRPAQYLTTYYRVAAGNVIVAVDGKPSLSCKPGNSFHLHWQNVPDFYAVTYSQTATLTVIGAETGAHLGVSDCLSASD